LVAALVESTVERLVALRVEQLVGLLVASTVAKKVERLVASSVVAMAVEKDDLKAASLVLELAANWVWKKDNL